MSRLKLRRFRVKMPPPDVLAQYCIVYDGKTLYFAPETLPDLSSPALFGNNNPLIVDLGCGRGEWLLKLALEHPDHNIIGIDNHWKSVWDAVNKLHAANCHNAKIVRADLRQVLVKAVAEDATAIFLLFPPPRLEENRVKDDLLNQDRMHDIHRWLMPDALFHFATDHEEYFEQKVAQLTQSGLFELLDLNVGFEGGQTAFQARWERWGITSKRATFKRR